MPDEHDTRGDDADILVERIRRAGGIARSADLDIVAQLIRNEFRARDAALRDARAEIERLNVAVSDLESGYQNSAELAMTYHGQLERAREALAPFAAFAAKAESFVRARAADGGSPILPSTDFRVADFRRADAALRLLARIDAERGEVDDA